MSTFIWFDTSMIRLPDLEDGPKIGYNCLGGLSHQLTLRDGTIPNGSKVTSYREDGTSEKQWIYHSYQTNIQVLDSKEGEESCVIQGDFILGHGLLVEDPRNPGRYVKQGLWQGDDWSGTYMMGAEIGEWEIEVEDRVFQYRINGRGSGSLVTDRPDTFRRDQEKERTEANKRLITKAGK